MVIYFIFNFFKENKRDSHCMKIKLSIKDWALERLDNLLFSVALYEYLEFGDEIWRIIFNRVRFIMEIF